MPGLHNIIPVQKLLFPDSRELQIRGIPVTPDQTDDVYTMNRTLIQTEMSLNLNNAEWKIDRTPADAGIYGPVDHAKLPEQHRAGILPGQGRSALR